MSTRRSFLVGAATVIATKANAQSGMKRVTAVPGTTLEVPSDFFIPDPDTLALKFRRRPDFAMGNSNLGTMVIGSVRDGKIDPQGLQKFADDIEMS